MKNPGSEDSETPKLKKSQQSSVSRSRRFRIKNKPNRFSEKKFSWIENGKRVYQPHYLRWKGMIFRCYYPGSPFYKYWGARGIRICEEWRDFWVFQKWCIETYEDGRSIDRINNDGPYSSDNCRWATQSTQVLNSRQYTPARVLGRMAWYKKSQEAMHRKFGDPRKRVNKTCNKCLEVKTMEEFHKEKLSPDGRRYECTLCLNKIRRLHAKRKRLSK